MQEVPVIYVDVDDERAMRILLADNRTNDVASYDGETLADLLEHLESTDDGLAGTGYDGDALDELLHDLGRDKPDAPLDDEGAETDRAEELREEWQTERGQLWQVGRHRLLCGDSTDAGDVERLLDGAEPKIVWADPPFGINYTGHGASKDGSANHFEPIEGDDEVDTSFLDYLLPTEAIYLKTTWKVLHEWEKALAARYRLRSRIVWDKCSHVAGDVEGGYATQTEIILFAGDAQTERFDSDLWTIERATTGSPDDRTGHPYESPVALPQRPIRNHKGDVYDPFVGSGTTLIAAQNEGRTCYAMEIDPAYCAVILERCTKAGLECTLVE